MAVITRRNGIPLFSDIKGALRWGRFNRLKGGYHVHYWQGQKGYMGGNNHSELAKRRPVKIDAIIAAQHEANNPLQRMPVRLAQPVQPVRLVPPRELEQPARSTISRTTSRITNRTTSSGGSGGY